MDRITVKDAIAYMSPNSKRARHDTSCGTAASSASASASTAAAAPLNRAAAFRASRDYASFSAEQRAAFEDALRGASMFITGRAGTGKSWLLRGIIQALPPSSTFVTATTGVAAVNIGGTTVHAFGGIGIGNDNSDKAVKKAARGFAGKRWRMCKTLVIDEISMLDSGLLDLLNRVAQCARGSLLPFGGIHVIACGDFLQLPPVQPRSEAEQRGFAFQSPVWQQLFTRSVMLRHVFRQDDGSRFCAFLDNVRMGQVTPDVHQMLLELRATRLATGDGIEPTILHTHRDDVDGTNTARLAALPGEQHVYMAVDTGTEPFLGQLQRGCIARATLYLKAGAQVMLLKNISPERGLVNGARGVLLDFQPNLKEPGELLPCVKFACGETRVLARETWDVMLGDTPVASRRQVPLDLAWALTVHKSQGMTLDRVQLRLDRVFAPGMAYVALSRVRRPEHMELLAYDAARIRADATVLKFYESLATSSALHVPADPRHKRL